MADVTAHIADRAPAAPTGHGPGNTHERTSSLTLFSTIRGPLVPLVRAMLWLARHLPTARRHILQFEFIHFVRWAIVREVPGQKLHYSYLFFQSDFDGPWRHYIDAFAYVIPKDIRFVWGCGPDFPGPPPAEPLKEWIARNSMEGGHFYCAYPRASTRMVNGALVVEERFRELVRESERLEPRELAAAYERFLTDVQAHL